MSSRATIPEYQPSASGDITRQGFRVTLGLIFWYVTLEAMWYMYNAVSAIFQLCNGGERERSDRQCVWQVLQWRGSVQFTETVQRGLLQQVSQDDQQEGDLFTLSTRSHSHCRWSPMLLFIDDLFLLWKITRYLSSFCIGYLNPSYLAIHIIFVLIVFNRSHERGS